MDLLGNMFTYIVLPVLEYCLEHTLWLLAACFISQSGFYSEIAAFFWALTDVVPYALSAFTLTTYNRVKKTGGHKEHLYRLWLCDPLAIAHQVICLLDCVHYSMLLGSAWFATTGVGISGLKAKTQCNVCHVPLCLRGL